MDIKTDFIPKPGDTVNYRNAKGQSDNFVWVACPDCANERWVRLYSTKRGGFTGRCKKCNIERSKREEWR